MDTVMEHGWSPLSSPWGQHVGPTRLAAPQSSPRPAPAGSKSSASLVHHQHTPPRWKQILGAHKRHWSNLSSHVPWPAASAQGAAPSKPPKWWPLRSATSKPSPPASVYTRPHKRSQTESSSIQSTLRVTLRSHRDSASDSDDMVSYAFPRPPLHSFSSSAHSRCTDLTPTHSPLSTTYHSDGPERPSRPHQPSLTVSLPGSVSKCARSTPSPLSAVSSSESEAEASPQTLQGSDGSLPLTRTAPLITVPTYPADVVRWVDGVRGVLFSLSQLNTVLGDFVASVPALCGQGDCAHWARPLDAAQLAAPPALRSLISALDQFDLRQEGDGPAAVLAVVQACVRALWTFSSVPVALARAKHALMIPWHQPRFQGEDVRLARRLVLSLYGSTVELANSWAVLAAERERASVREYLRIAHTQANSPAPASWLELTDDKSEPDEATGVPVAGDDDILVSPRHLSTISEHSASGPPPPPPSASSSSSPAPTLSPSLIVSLPPNPPCRPSRFPYATSMPRGLPSL